MPEGMKGRNFLRHLALDGPRRYVDSVSSFGPAEQAQLLSPAALDQVRRSDPVAQALRHLARPGHWLSAIQRWDLECYLPLDINAKVDRMTMAHSIEARPPLLDHKLVEFAASIPPSLRLKGTTTKYLFKRAMRGILPDTIIDRPKRGFTMPLGHWFRTDWAPFVRDMLLSDTCRQRGLFSANYIETVLRLHAGGRDMNVQLWALVSLELWCRAFLDPTGKGRLVPATERVVRPRAVSRLQPQLAEGSR
jgi:asparagine synthase (glutamine-hydrolysing)